MKILLVMPAEGIVGRNPASLPLREGLWRWAMRAIVRPHVRTRHHRATTN